MSRRDRERLADVRTAIAAIRAHLTRGALDDGLVFDAVRMRLVEIGEAVKSITPELLVSEADIPWREIAKMRDRLAHQYFDTVHAIVVATVGSDLEESAAAIDRLDRRAG